METYCFNYSVSGIRTFLPVYICCNGKNILQAFNLARKYLKEKNKGRTVKIWLRNYPQMIDKEFQTKTVPDEWIQKNLN